MRSHAHHALRAPCVPPPHRHAPRPALGPPPRFPPPAPMQRPLPPPLLSPPLHSITEVTRSGQPLSATNELPVANATALLRNLSPGATYAVRAAARGGVGGQQLQATARAPRPPHSRPRQLPQSHALPGAAAATSVSTQPRGSVVVTPLPPRPPRPLGLLPHPPAPHLASPPSQPLLHRSLTSRPFPPALTPASPRASCSPSRPCTAPPPARPSTRPATCARRCTAAASRCAAGARAPVPAARRPAFWLPTPCGAATVGSPPCARVPSLSACS